MTNHITYSIVSTMTELARRWPRGFAFQTPHEVHLFQRSLSQSDPTNDTLSAKSVEKQPKKPLAKHLDLISQKVSR